MKASTFDRWNREARLVINKICRVYNLWHLKDEMLSESYVALTKLVREGGNVDEMDLKTVRTIIKRAVIDFLRSWFGRRGHKNSLYLEDLFKDDKGISRWPKRIRNGKGPEERFLTKELEEKLYSALEKLSEKERFVIEKVYLEEMEGREVARMLGVTPGMVSQYKSSAMKKLKKILEKKMAPIVED